MKKSFKVVLALAGILLLLVSVGVGALFFAPSRTLRSNLDRISGVSQYFVFKDGSQYIARFSLVNNDNSWATSDAIATFVIKLDNGTELYSRQYNVLSTDFQTYQLPTGQPVVAYAWQINASDLHYGDLDFPKAFLSVTLPNGKTFNAETMVV